MRKLMGLIVAMVMVSSVAFAGVLRMDDTIKAANQSTLGGIETTSSVVASGSYAITGFAVSASGTAQTCGLFDATSQSQIAWASTGSTTGLFEASVAANSSVYYDFRNSPLQTTNGIYLFCTRTDGTAVIYTQK